MINVLTKNSSRTSLPTTDNATYQYAFSMMPHGAYVKTKSGDLIFWNADVDETIATQSELVAVEQSVMTHGNTQTNVPIKRLGENGKHQHLSFDCQPWRTESGEIQGCIGLLRDVTAEKKEQAALAESAHLLELVLEHLPVRVFWKDNDLVYMGCNTIFANDMGHGRPEMLIGTDDFNTSMTAPEAEMCRADDRFVIDNETARYGIEEIIGSEEDGTWIRVSKVPLYSTKDEKLGVLGMYEDITEGKRAQIEMEKALHRAEQLNRLKTNFISTVSHEYRNPLSSITLYVNSMMRFNDRISSEMRLERLEKIKQEVERMTSLMNDVLFIGRDDLNMIDPTYEAIDIEALSQEVITQLDTIENDASGRIRTTYEGTKQPLIGSPLHLTQVVNNLLINALKYSDDHVDFTLVWGDDEVTIMVKDSGIGIPEDDHAHIFDSFFRSNSVGTIEGNGLGLFIVHRAVELHKGTISFVSTVGEGTSFTVTIPMRPTTMGSFGEE